MKVFFDTNVYVAEALLGQGAQRMIEATLGASWRIYTSPYVLAETQRVIRDKLGFSSRYAALTRIRILRRTAVVESLPARHEVPADPADNPILQAALGAGVDYLVTNDEHLLKLNPYEGMQIIPMNDYLRVLENEGLLRDK